MGTVPRKVVVAFSGGVDSVAAADFLIRGGRDVSLAFFHHGTPASDVAEPEVRAWADGRGVSLTVGRISRERGHDESPEEFWRNERYGFLGSLGLPVVTAHHLGDAVESWIFTSLHGEPRLIPPVRGPIIRPFLTTTKEEFTSWCTRRGLPWVEDPSNQDDRYMRNFIRHNLVPMALRVNPGLPKVIRKKYMELYKNDE